MTAMAIAVLLFCCALTVAQSQQECKTHTDCPADTCCLKSGIGSHCQPKPSRGEHCYLALSANENYYSDGCPCKDDYDICMKTQPGGMDMIGTCVAAEK